MIEVRTTPFMKSMLTLTGALTGIGILVYGVTQHPLKHYSDTKIVHYKSPNAREMLESTNNQIRAELDLDTLNHKGVSGRMEYDASSGELLMIIRNRKGQHIPGIEVVAQLSRADGRRGPQLRMRQNAKQYYSTPIRGIGPGRWHVAIQAYDPERTSGSGVVFQVEKYMNIK